MDYNILHYGAICDTIDEVRWCYVREHLKFDVKLEFSSTDLYRIETRIVDGRFQCFDLEGGVFTIA